MMSKNENKRKIWQVYRPKRLLFVALPIILMGVLLDQAVKLWATAALRQKDIILLPNILKLTYVENTGAAFSMLEGGRWFFLALTAVALLIGLYVLVFGRIRHWLGFLALCFVLAGAVGNMVDRILYGYVVDMFEPLFVRFAVFNVADIFLTLGGIALALYVLFWHEEKPLQKESGTGEGESAEHYR